MSSQDDTNGTSGERGKEHVMTLMHPQASVVAGRKHFFPYGKHKDEIATDAGRIVVS